MQSCEFPVHLLNAFGSSLVTSNLDSAKEFKFFNAKLLNT